MAAWLAYLKSCLLLPKDPEQDPSPEEIALRLQMRLQRLDAMREAGARLLGRDRIGRDVFLRGAPEGLRLVRKAAWQVRDFDLFAAYGVVRARTQPAMHVVHARSVMTLEEALERVGRMIGHGARLDLPRKLPALDAGSAVPQVGARVELPCNARACEARPARHFVQDEAVRADPGEGRLMDELMRAIEATLFASADAAHRRGDRRACRRGRGRNRARPTATHYEGHGIELVERGGRWHFQTAPDLAHLLRRTREEPRRLSRAATETLAIIAYHEPVSRAEIEAIRGVQISKGTLDVLMDAGWVRPAGPPRGTGPAVALCDDAGVPDALRAGFAARSAGHRRS